MRGEIRSSRNSAEMIVIEGLGRSDKDRVALKVSAAPSPDWACSASRSG